MGPANAPLQLVEFADFECPFCAVSADAMRELRVKYPDVVTVVFRHLPIPGHLNARAAALSAECAAEQGAFEAYYYVLFQRYAAVTKRSWRRHAAEAKVSDLDAFDRCVESERYAARIDADTAVAKLLGIRSTPSWVVGDSMYAGTPSVAQLERWVQAAIERRRRSDAPAQPVSPQTPEN